jgi:hypothetical protein
MIFTKTFHVKYFDNNFDVIQKCLRKCLNPRYESAVNSFRLFFIYNYNVIPNIFSLSY